jgi:hypothetical protein
LFAGLKTAFLWVEARDMGKRGRAEDKGQESNGDLIGKKKEVP